MTGDRRSVNVVFGDSRVLSIPLLLVDILQSPVCCNDCYQSSILRFGGFRER